MMSRAETCSTQMFHDRTNFQAHGSRAKSLIQKGMSTSTSAPPQMQKPRQACNKKTCNMHDALLQRKLAPALAEVVLKHGQAVLERHYAGQSASCRAHHHTLCRADTGTIVHSWPERCSREHIGQGCSVPGLSVADNVPSLGYHSEKAG